MAGKILDKIADRFVTELHHMRLVKGCVTFHYLVRSLLGATTCRCLALSTYAVVE